jgi:hypothetical protein
MAGEWARVKGTVAGLWPVFLSVFAAGVSVALAFVSSTVGIALFIVSFACIGAGLHFGLQRIERFFIGARGEERVSGILADLPDRYHVFNDFVAGGTHVDHVVIGPAGVFAVETKFWRGDVTIEEGYILVDGQLPSRPPLKQVLREASLVRAELAKSGWGGPVTPVLAFASDTFRPRVAELNGVVVINSSELRKGFATERVVIPQAELDRLLSLMENDA